MNMRRTVVLSASAALAVLLFGAAALLWTQQAQAEEFCVEESRVCLDKMASASTVEVGEQITFTIRERCLGEGRTCGFGSPLVDTLPSGLTVDSVVPEGPLQPSDYQCSTSVNTVTCPAPRFATSEQPFTLTIVATTTECGTFTNTASNSSSTVESTVESTFTVVGCPPSLPMTKAECKNGGWMVFGYPDQGTCISDVNQRNK